MLNVRCAPYFRKNPSVLSSLRQALAVVLGNFSFQSRKRARQTFSGKTTAPNRFDATSFRLDCSPFQRVPPPRYYLAAICFVLCPTYSGDHVTFDVLSPGPALSVTIPGTTIRAQRDPQKVQCCRYSLQRASLKSPALFPFYRATAGKGNRRASGKCSRNA